MDADGNLGPVPGRSTGLHFQAKRLFIRFAVS